MCNGHIWQNSPGFPFIRFLVSSSCCSLIHADIRQQGGSFYLFYDDEEEKWVDTRFFFGATIFNRLENDNSNYCVDSYSNW